MTPTFSFCSDFDLCCVTSVPGEQGGEQGSEQGSEQGNGGDGAVEALLGFYLHKHS